MEGGRRSVRRWLFWLAVAAFAWFVVSRAGDVRKLAATLAGGDGTWIALAAATQVLYFACFAWMFRIAFSCLGVRARLRHVILVVFGAVFVNTLAPSGGTAGMALYTDDAVRRGESGPAAAAGALLATVIDFIAFAVVLLAGMAYLLRHHELHSYEVAAAALLSAISGVQVAMLVLALARPRNLDTVLLSVERTVSRVFRRIGRRPPLRDGWATATASQLHEAAGHFRAHPGTIGHALVVGIASNIVSIATLYCLFQAFHQSATLGELVAGYAMAILFLNVSPVPQGIGVVEGLMALTLTSLGLPGAPVLAVTLVFRGMSLWIPIMIGFLVLRFLPSFSVRRPSPPLGRAGPPPSDPERLAG